MADIDFFKSINDEFGHSTGDEVLRKVAMTLKQAARDTDLVCRYGGEEFCVLMPDTDIDAAELAAERLRLAIAELKLPQLSVLPVQVKARCSLSLPGWTPPPGDRGRGR